jgi:hypothetical protein
MIFSDKLVHCMDTQVLFVQKVKDVSVGLVLLLVDFLLNQPQFSQK